MLNTDWEDDGEAINAVKWPVDAWAAECAWNGAVTAPDVFYRRLGAVLFGEAGHHFGDALALLAQTPQLPGMKGMMNARFWEDDFTPRIHPARIPSVASNLRRPPLTRQFGLLRSSSSRSCASSRRCCDANRSSAGFASMRATSVSNGSSAGSGPISPATVANPGRASPPLGDSSRSADSSSCSASSSRISLWQLGWREQLGLQRARGVDASAAAPTVCSAGVPLRSGE
jgi:hypothetical protein